MKPVVFIIALLLVSTYSLAQKKIEQYITSKGDTIKVGDRVQIGPGANPDGSFRFFDGFFTPGLNFTYSMVTVRAIIRGGNSKMGYEYRLKVHPEVGSVTYNIYIENALRVGELILKK